MSKQDSQNELRAKAHEAMDAYFDAGGTKEFYIVSQTDVDRMVQVAVDKLLQAIVDAADKEGLKVIPVSSIERLIAKRTAQLTNQPDRSKQ